MFRVEVFWAAIGLAVAAISSSASGENKPPASAGSSPLTVQNFIDDAILSMPKLSPSGHRIAIVRRVGDIDQVLRIDLPDLKSTLLYQTRKVPADLAKQHWRYRISYLDWKTEDTLIVSMSGPVGLDLYSGRRFYDVPIHMVLKADGASPPLLLNQKQKTNLVDLSSIQNILPNDPDHIQLFVRPGLASVEVDRVNIHTGEKEVLERGGEDVAGYGSDRQGNIVTRTLDGGFGVLTLQGRAPGEKRWTKITDIRAKEERELAKYDILGFGTPGVLYVAAKPEAAADGDTKTVHTYDLKTMTLGSVVWSNAKYDVDGIVQDDDTGEILAGCYWVDTYHCDFKNPRLTAHLKGLNKFFEDKRNLFIVSQSKDDNFWLLAVNGPDDAGSYYLYDVNRHDVRYLGDRFPDLASGRLSPVRRLDFKARDGLALSAYVTEPQLHSSRLAPLIVLPHGGPEERDSYEFNTWSQFLASQGYVVLQPNFRGSSGFGRKFAEAGYGEWGGRMHDDVMDATKALIAEGKVDPARVCIVGGSYGGYEALYSAAVEPQTFKCAVSVDGLSDIAGEMKFERTFGQDSIRYNYWLKARGDPAKDGVRLKAHSPYWLVASWKTPVLLIHGDDDQIVPVEESRQMKRALERAGKPVTYVEIANMEHGPSSNEEWTKVLTEINAFVGKYIGDKSGAK